MWSYAQNRVTGQCVRSRNCQRRRTSLNCESHPTSDSPHPFISCVSATKSHKTAPAPLHNLVTSLHFAFSDARIEFLPHLYPEYLDPTQKYHTSKHLIIISTPILSILLLLNLNNPPHWRPSSHGWASRANPKRRQGKQPQHPEKPDNWPPTRRPPHSWRLQLPA